jgi:hypothetical protein
MVLYRIAVACTYKGNKACSAAVGSVPRHRWGGGMKARRTTRALLLVCWAVMGAGFRSPPIGARRHGAVALAACDSEAHRDGLARATQVAQPTRRTLLRWLSFAAGGAASAADPAGAAPYPVQKTDAEWAELLSDQQRFVLRDGGTEAPNSSPLVLERRPGEYQCAGCGAGLFASAVKFEARTGWPSFAEAKQVVPRLPVRMPACPHEVSVRPPVCPAVY